MNLKHARKVHVLKADGSPLYDHLWDDGSLVLPFDTPGGFVDRLDVERERWTIVDGWRKP